MMRPVYIVYIPDASGELTHELTRCYEPEHAADVIRAIAKSKGCGLYQIKLVIQGEISNEGQ